jgi:hypothetical protein
MLDSGSKSIAGIAILVLLFSSMVASCNLGGNSGLDDANRLDQSAGEDIREIERLVQENKDKESEVTRARNAGDYNTARRLMDDSVQAIDRGLEKAQSAADKLDKASSLDVNSTIKAYLSLRAQSANKAIEALRELRQGVITYRDSTGSTDKAAIEKAKNETQQSFEKYEKLISESDRLQREADDIARRNPDTIKPGR